MTTGQGILLALKGAAMGAANVIPGVSGGTIALILGVYERLLASIRTGARSLGRLAQGDVSGFIEQFKSIEWPFIIPLGTGIVAAFLQRTALARNRSGTRPWLG